MSHGGGLHSRGPKCYCFFYTAQLRSSWPLAAMKRNLFAIEKFNISHIEENTATQSVLTFVLAIRIISAAWRRGGRESRAELTAEKSVINLAVAKKK